jgi:hypothetical protein
MTEGTDHSVDDSLLRAIACAPDAAPPDVKPPGEIVAGRFVIEKLARAGGMGTVYRAFDRVNAAPVALKFVRHEKHDAERFAQEARVLAELHHPAIVRYVAHGTTTQGQAFLAMEWLDGEDLRERLAHAGLAVAESVALARRVAGGLATAHARGVVHRDVKPSNVLLLDGDPARAKLLDFGIVRLQDSAPATSARSLTGSGVVLGTVGYMSPEQAMGDRALDARTDVFALGCVLFECLTGRPAFSGAHVVAVLAKVLREEAPRVREFRQELSPMLDELVGRMLSKDKAGRPSDGSALLRELEGLGSLDGGAPAVRHRRPLGLSGGEQRLVSVVLAVVPAELDRVGEIVRRHGGDPARLANGALLVTLGGRRSTTEQVVSAAACAMELRQAFPSARVALATGRARTTAGGPLGPAIDQAATLLAHSMSPGIRIDEVTAGLLGDRFEVRPDGAGRILVAQRRDAEPPRTLLGKPTPCVGREKELGLLDLTLRECIDESVARAVLVTGPAGQGKSRLRYEFMAKVRERGDVGILMARADPVGAGSAFMLVRQLIRRAVGLQEVSAESGQEAKLLRAYVGRVCVGSDVGRIADFLGELLSVPSTERASPELRAARNDPQVMAVWLRRSFGDWLAAGSAARPLLIVVEDLHWGDLPSVTYLGDGLRALSARPLMLLALGRLEVHDAFPSLWTGAEVHEVPLARLAPRAAERLVRAALGEGISAEAVAGIVERADGNAFYLEELVRRVAEGGGDTLPETVLALAESRLERLDAEARRVVRAASVFGEVFWRGGVAALLGEASAEGYVDEWLSTLCEREVLSAAHECCFAGESAYRFRHGLLREAAYAMLTDDDRSTGHRLAGEWLEAAGETDALAMADHFEKGEDPKRALPWLVRAAQSAFDGGNVEAAKVLACRGLACGPDATQRAALLGTQALVSFVGGDWRTVVEMGREGLGLVPAGSTQWFSFMASFLTGGVFLRNRELWRDAIQAILNVSLQPEPSGPYGFSVQSMCFALGAHGQSELARPFLERAEGVEKSASDPDPVFVAWLRLARAWLHLYGEELGGALANAREAQSLADHAHAPTAQAQARVMHVMTLAQTGDCKRAETCANDLLKFSDPIGFIFYRDWARYALALAQVNANRAAEAVASLREFVARADPDSTLVGSAWGLLAHALVEGGDLDAGAREAEALAAKFPGRAVVALALLAIRRHEPAQALALAERRLDAPFRGEAHVVSVLRLVRAEALKELGRTEDARIAIREARDRVLRNAATLDGDAELQQAYVTNVGAHARTLELAAQCL